MKRRDIIRKLKAAGLTIEEGGNHSLVYRDGRRVSAIPRHSEIKTVLVRAIERQTGVKLLLKGLAMQTFFPAVVEADPVDGGFGVEVVGTGINGQGDTEIAALQDAAEILQEVVWDSVARGDDLPRPGTPSGADLARGRIALLQITLPADAHAA